MCDSGVLQSDVLVDELALAWTCQKLLILLRGDFRMHVLASSLVNDMESMAIVADVSNRRALDWDEIHG